MSDQHDIRASARASAAALNQWPLIVVLAVVACGLGVVALGQWRWGAILVGAGVGLAAVLRLVLSRRSAGLLEVRSRWFDVSLLTVLAAGIIVLAVTR